MQAHLAKWCTTGHLQLCSVIVGQLLNHITIFSYYYLNIFSSSSFYSFIITFSLMFKSAHLGEIEIFVTTERQRKACTKGNTSADGPDFWPRFHLSFCHAIESQQLCTAETIYYIQTTSSDHRLCHNVVLISMREGVPTPLARLRRVHSALRKIYQRSNSKTNYKNLAPDQY